MVETRSNRRGVFARVAGAAVMVGALATLPLIGSPAAAAATRATLSFSTTLLNFGDVPIGTISSPQFVTVTNTGHASVTLSGTYTLSGPFLVTQTCRANTLTVGSSCLMMVSFRPTAPAPAAGWIAGEWSGQSFFVRLVGNHGPQFSISPTGFDFGDVAVGTTATQQRATIKNLGPTAVVMSGAGGGAGIFGGSQDCQGKTLAVGATCHMFYAFHPTVAGAQTGSTGGNWNGQTFSFAFKGNGINRFLITPTAFDFGDVKVGTTSPQQKVAITNLGNAAVVMSGAGGGAGIFGGSQDCQGLTIAPGKTCHMYYAFHPTAAGAQTGSTGGNWNGQTFSFAFKGKGA